MPRVVVLGEFEDGVEHDHLSLDVFLPNGIVVTANANIYATFEDLKHDVWCQAPKYPLYKLLKKPEAYCFVSINQHGEKEEILDESQCLSDIRPYCTFMKLVEKAGNKKHATLMSLIGREPKHVQRWQKAEISDFRSQMRQLCDRLVQARNQRGWTQELAFRFPARLRMSQTLSVKITQHIAKGLITVVHLDEEEGKKSFTIRIPVESTPEELIQDVLLKLSLIGHTVEQPASYLLKSYLLEEYFYGGEHPLHQYKYVYQCLNTKTAPQFILVPRDAVLSKDQRPKVPLRRPSIDAGNTSPEGGTGSVCVWNIDQRYHFSVRGISKIQIPDGTKVRLHMGLFHGSENLCPVQKSEECLVQGGDCNLKMEVKFDIFTRDIPQMARLCFTLLAKKASLAIAWVNIPLFDFRSVLVKGLRDLPMWPPTSDGHSEEILNPIGSVAPNPLGFDTTTLHLVLPDFNQTRDIIYPSFDKADPQMLEDAAVGMAGEDVSRRTISAVEESSTRKKFEMLVDKTKCLSALYEQDKELLWEMRYECQRYHPHSLPKVLSSVRWNNHQDVAKMMALLHTWPKLEVDYALQLLDFHYPDKNVRKFAVSCLQNTDLFSDDDLSRYLLQLVQALKYETHLCNPLVEFLLTRSLGNQHIAHQLFWLLKSEMHNPYVTVQNRLILEVYLAASGEHMMGLHREQEALAKLSSVNNLMKSNKYTMADQKSQDDALKDMQMVLQQKTYQESMQNISCPLSMLYNLGSLDPDRCKIMKSKKRPLWLVWKKPHGPDVSLIYKNGDDLRQDMLTLQMLEIMDHIWQAEGLDLRMSVYRCMSTGHKQGVIEAVEESDTIAKIQMWFNRGAFDKKAVFEWLKMHNTTKESLDAAVEEFILSCAGYCVATYVLGIGDRHNDNIMLKRTGQLFHIDFGHFLGNFKKKLFIDRDRVPFVLTNHFTHVIKNGTESKEHPNYVRFQNYCEKAYLILRRKAPLLFSLFLMMLSSGIPQLMCVKDVDYLRETLKPDLSEDEAIAHFEKVFRRAEKYSYTATINFQAHIIANYK